MKSFQMNRGANMWPIPIYELIQILIIPTLILAGFLVIIFLCIKWGIETIKESINDRWW